MKGDQKCNSGGKTLYQPVSKQREIVKDLKRDFRTQVHTLLSRTQSHIPRGVRGLRGIGCPEARMRT